ncbi:MAG: YbjN domain-containing protein [Planctomycetota bacterium]
MTSTGDPDAVQQAAAQVEELLQAELEGAFKRVGEVTFVAKRGSAVVAIRVEEGEGEPLIHVEANVVEGATLDAEILRQLLEFNHGSAFGAFGVDEDGTITVHHCLLVSALSAATLVPAVKEVARIADDWDDVLVEQAGGKTAVERLTERLQPRAQPTIVPARGAADSPPPKE